MISLAVVATVFALVFVGELPDKTAVACLVLGSRYPAAPVLTGTAAAFAVHVTAAVALGGLLGRLPQRPVALTTAALFLLGALLVLRADVQHAAASGEQDAARVTGARGAVGVAASAFGVVLVAEFADLTQVLTVGLAAGYHDSVSVAAGALLALWSVSALAVLLGRTLLHRLRAGLLQRLGAGVLAALGVNALVLGLVRL